MESDFCGARLLRSVVVIVFGIALSVPAFGFTGVIGDVDAAPAETVLRMGFLERVDSLNPYTGLSDSSYVFYSLVYDCLQGVGNDVESTPNLAMSWGPVPEDDPELVASGEPYGAVWQYNLTENATWHDGEPFTADDVVWNINLCAGNYTEMWAFQPYAYYAQSAAKVDESTVRVHFFDRDTGDPIPVAYGDSMFIPMLPRHKLDGMSAPYVGFTWNGLFLGEDPPMVGTGPFMATTAIYDEWLAGDTLTLVRNPDYHGQLDYGQYVHFDKIRMEFFDDPTAMRIALAVGIIDVAEYPPAHFLNICNDVESGAYEDVATFTGPKVTQRFIEIGFNFNAGGGDNPARLDPAVREAMALATNKTFITENIYFKCGEPGSTLVSGSWHYEPTPGELFDYDLDAANALLEDAGYVDTDEDGIREATIDSWAVQQSLVPEGTELAFDMLVRWEPSEEREVATFLDYWWQEVGIDVTYIVVDEMMFWTIVYSYDYDLFIGHWSADPDPNYILFTQSEAAWYGWSDNLYSNTSYEENYSRSVTEMDPSTRAAFVDECQRIHYLDLGYIILVYPNQTYAWRTDTFTGWGDWEADPGRSVDACWSGNPLYFDLIPTAVPDMPPTGALLLASPSSTSVGDVIEFNASAVDDEGAALRFYIEFGDGSSDSANAPDGMDHMRYYVNFSHTYLAPGTYEATVWISDDADNNVSAEATVWVYGSTDRSVSYRWHDMFNVPFGEWWDARQDVYGYYDYITDSYPYIVKHDDVGSPSPIWSTSRLDIVGSNMPTLNTSWKPEFLPMLGSTTGGNAEINWYMQYMTSDELLRFPVIWPWNDGWIVSLNGTVVLDEACAATVLDLTHAGFLDFENWWADNSDAIEMAYLDWLEYEGNVRLDIYNMYEYPLTFLYFDLDAEKVGENIVLTYDTVSWGMEALMTRWLHNAFMPTEWWFEDMTFRASIGPEATDLAISAAVPYSFFAYATVDEWEPVWAWMGKLQDCVPSSLAHPYSALDIYLDKQYLDRYPGCGGIGTMVDYDYVPAAWNLSVGEALTFEWPDGPQLFFKNHTGDIIPEAEWIPGTVNMTGEMKCVYAEPWSTDFSGQVEADNYLRTLSFIGPIDMYSWSEDQTAHDFLEDEWDRVGLLPYGIPYVEFGMADNTPPVAALTVSPFTGDVETEFSFDASGSHDAEDDVSALEVQWDWEGDGIWDTSWTTVKTASHTYAAVGTYDAIVNVTDTAGLYDTATVTITVTEIEDEDTTPPVADAGPDQSVKVGQTVTFTGAGSSDDVGVVDYAWAIMDGTTNVGTMIGIEPSHTFTEAGTYAVTLLVMDAAGNWDTDTMTVTVTDSDGGGVSGTTLAIIAVVVIAAIAVVLFFLMKKKAPGPPAP